MKAKKIQFFSPADNAESAPKKAIMYKPLTGYISPKGKVVLPAKALEDLGLSSDNARFRVGRQEGKGAPKSLYLVPATDETPDAFELVKTGRGFSLPLAGVLRKNGVSFGTDKVGFMLDPFQYEDGQGYELIFDIPVIPSESTGKQRGRKPKAQVLSE